MSSQAIESPEIAVQSLLAALQAGEYAKAAHLVEPQSTEGHQAEWLQIVSDWMASHTTQATDSSSDGYDVFDAFADLGSVSALRKLTPEAFLERFWRDQSVRHAEAWSQVTRSRILGRVDDSVGQAYVVLKREGTSDSPSSAWMVSVVRIGTEWRVSLNDRLTIPAGLVVDTL